MAQLKDTVVAGNLRVTDATQTDSIQARIVNAPASSGASTYSPGTDGQVLKSNGTTAYWGTSSSTDANVTQTATTTNSAYEVLFSGTADNTTRTEGARKTSTLTYNPSTKALVTGGTVNGYTLAGASAKAVDTTIANASSSANLPTSSAVASFVEGKGYTTNTGTVTGVKVNGTTKSPTSGVVDIGTVITDVSGKSDKTATVSTVTYDTTNKKITKTINGTTTDVVAVSTLKTDMALAKGDVGLGNVENKSSATIRGELTSSNVTTALGYTPYNSTNPNGYTSNTGTVTGVKVNGTTKQPTSGVVDIGTVITDVSGKADKQGTVLTTTLSRGRKSSTSVSEGSFAFGNNVEASGIYSFATGVSTVASGYYAHAEGQYSKATNTDAHAEGSSCQASGEHSHAEGMYSKSIGSYSHAEGYNSQIHGDYSHGEGRGTYTYGSACHVGGKFNSATNPNDFPLWVGGTEYSVGDCVKRDNGNSTYKYYVCKTANTDAGFVSSNWNTWDDMYVEIIGNGTSSAKSNARALDWDGNEYLKGDVYVGCNADSTGGIKLTPGVQPFTIQLDTVTASGDTYTHTTQNASVTSEMKPIQIEYSNPEIFKDNVTVSTGDGEITLTCDDVNGASEVYVTLMKQSDPQVPSVTSNEFDILSGRIGTLSSLETSEKSTLVGAINEVNTKMYNFVTDGNVTSINITVKQASMHFLIIQSNATSAKYVGFIYSGSEGATFTDVYKGTSVTMTSSQVSGNNVITYDVGSTGRKLYIVDILMYGDPIVSIN